FHLLIWAGIGVGSICGAEGAHTKANLVLAAETVRPGETVLAGVALRMDRGWHTYWQNPGASGLATKINWELPPGVSAGSIQWPVPKKLTEEGLTTYSYENEAVLLVPLTFASDLKPGTLELKAKLSWLECQTSCIPGNADVRSSLTVGSETKPSKDAELISNSQKKLPQSGTGSFFCELLINSASFEGLVSLPTVKLERTSALPGMQLVWHSNQESFAFNSSVPGFKSDANVNGTSNTASFS